jgi:alpha-ketoglutarate-dependent taurine dioxygenase
MISHDQLMDVNLTAMDPFGAVLSAAPTARDPRALAPDFLTGLVAEHRVVILRGFATLSHDEFPEFCRRIGELQEWDFGVVNNLRVDPQAENYLYTNREVPFHWDGAFAGRIPHYIIFHCDVAPADGSGETLFCDSLRLLAAAPSELVNQWRQIEITYTTEKIVHYGGSFSSPLIARHPENHREILRFAEPVFDLNPVRVEIRGLADQTETDFLADLHQRLRRDAFCYRHTWRTGDLVIADNYVLLHARREFAPGVKRQIRRVNVF